VLLVNLPDELSAKESEKSYGLIMELEDEIGAIQSETTVLGKRSCGR
jgi:hypothetical protein